IESVRDLADSLLEVRAHRRRQRERLLAEVDVADDVARALSLDVVGCEPDIVTRVEVVEAVDASNAYSLLEVHVVLEADLGAAAARSRVEAQRGRELGEGLPADAILET